MEGYWITTDSDSDLPYAFADEKGIPVIRMPYVLDGKEYYDDNGRSGCEKAFFAALRRGAQAKTAMLTTEDCVAFFEPLLKEGDVLHIAFSSQLSGMYQNVLAARERLMAKYPGRRFHAIDTKRISMPQALLVQRAQALKEGGMGVDEVANWVLENRLCAMACFSVDDLGHLRRGGRLSATAALFGQTMNIKPILTFSDEGKIEVWQKVRGEKRVLQTLASWAAENIVAPETQRLVIMHGDAEKPAQKLAALVREMIPDIMAVDVIIVGPVIGTHCGPGTLSCCFMGKGSGAKS